MKNFLSKNSITIRSKGNYHVLKFDLILFFEAVHHKTRIHYLNHTIQDIDVKLDEVELKLKNHSFWRSDLNYIIHLKYLEKVSGNDENNLLMKGDYRVPIDENRKHILLEELAKIG